MVTPENNLGLLGKGGRGLVEQADLENCAYFWKNPGYAPENPARLFVSVLHRGASRTQRQKFHTDDEKSVRNPVKSADWSTDGFLAIVYE